MSEEEIAALVEEAATGDPETPRLADRVEVKR
jgi:hypothetical protein